MKDLGYLELLLGTGYAILVCISLEDFDAYVFFLSYLIILILNSVSKENICVHSIANFAHSFNFYFWATIAWWVIVIGSVSSFLLLILLLLLKIRLVSNHLQINFYLHGNTNGMRTLRTASWVGIWTIELIIVVLIFFVRLLCVAWMLLYLFGLFFKLEVILHPIAASSIAWGISLVDLQSNAVRWVNWFHGILRQLWIIVIVGVVIDLFNFIFIEWVLVEPIEKAFVGITILRHAWWSTSVLR